MQENNASYKIGDRIFLQEYDFNRKMFTGAVIYTTILSIAFNQQKYGLIDGYLIVSISIDKLGWDVGFKTRYETFVGEKIALQKRKEWKQYLENPPVVQNYESVIQQKILDILKMGDKMRQKICEIMQRPMTTVYDNLKILVKKGLITKYKKCTGELGPPRTFYHYS